MKKILLALIALTMAAIFAASYAVRQAPVWLRAALEQSLGKSVAIRSIDFQFPTTFILTGVSISEKEGPFAGEPEFTAETVRVSAVPTSLKGRSLTLDEIDVREASVIVRRSGGRLYHALSKPSAPAENSSAPGEGRAPAVPQVLSVAFLRVADSRFQFHDFDAGEKGFVFDCEGIDARVTGFQVPASSRKTSYAIEGRLLQGRDEKPAAFSVSGVTAFETLETAARGELKGLHLPYFAPYALRITSAVIEEGYLDLRAQAQIQDRQLSLDSEWAFTSLFFRSLEGDNQLFGLSAAEILDFLKDSSGRLRIPVSVRWTIGDRSVRLRTLVRQAVEASLKRTVFGNVGALLEAAIVRIGEKGLDVPEKTSETVLKKIKDFLKY